MTNNEKLIIEIFDIHRENIKSLLSLVKDLHLIIEDLNDRVKVLERK